MAIQEHTEEINDINLTSTKCGIVLSADNKILSKNVGCGILTKKKVVTGTLLQIDAYIEANSLEDYIPEWDR
tara:strand:+ start:112 stop:327 length:216 start_codon:yes stop_codon:yes gene_type:complete